MIDAPSSIEEVLALPSVDLESLDALPGGPGIYFVVLGGERVGYVGISTISLRGRWMDHHRTSEFRQLVAPMLHYLLVGPGYPLADAEFAAIVTFSPEFNGHVRSSQAETNLVLLPDAARELGISHVTAWRYVKADRLKARRLGPLYVIRRADLEAFKAQTRTVGRPRKPTP